MPAATWSNPATRTTIDRKPRAVLLDELEDDDGQTRRRSAHRERRALHGTDQQTTDDPGHQAERRRHPRCKGNPEAEWEGDEEHDNGGERVRCQSAPVRGTIHDRLAPPGSPDAARAGSPDSVDLEKFGVASISTGMEAWAGAGGAKPRWRKRGEGRRPTGASFGRPRKVSPPVEVRKQQRGG
jgi:hypothetical protein